MAKHLSGRKITKSHSTVTEEARRVALKAVEIDLVKRISLGRIRVAPRGEYRITIQSKNKGALVLRVRMPNSIQDLIVFTDSIDQVLEELRKELVIFDKIK